MNRRPPRCRSLGIRNCLLLGAFWVGLLQPLANGETWTGADNGSYHVIHTPSGDVTIQYPSTNSWAAGEVRDSYGNILAPGNWSVPNYPDSATVDAVIGPPMGNSYPPLINSGSPIDVGRLTMLAGSQLQIRGANGVTAELIVHDAIDNQGTISLLYPGSFPFARSELFAGGTADVPLTGGGVVHLDGYGGADKPVSDWTIVALQGSSTTSRFINVDNTIAGGGFVGYGTAGLVNHAVIDANKSGTGLAIQPSATGVINDGLMRASNGGLLTLSLGAFANDGGTIQAQAGSAVQLFNASITGGLVEIQAGGVLRADGSSSARR